MFRVPAIVKRISLLEDIVRHSPETVAEPVDMLNFARVFPLSVNVMLPQVTVPAPTASATVTPEPFPGEIILTLPETFNSLVASVRLTPAPLFLPLLLLRTSVEQASVLTHR